MAWKLRDALFLHSQQPSNSRPCNAQRYWKQSRCDKPQMWLEHRHYDKGAIGFFGTNSRVLRLLAHPASKCSLLSMKTHTCINVLPSIYHVAPWYLRSSFGLRPNTSYTQQCGQGQTNRRHEHTHTHTRSTGTSPAQNCYSMVCYSTKYHPSGDY